MFILPASHNLIDIGGCNARIRLEEGLNVSQGRGPMMLIHVWHIGFANAGITLRICTIDVKCTKPRDVNTRGKGPKNVDTTHYVLHSDILFLWCKNVNTTHCVLHSYILYLWCKNVATTHCVLHNYIHFLWCLSSGHGCSHDTINKIRNQ